MLTEKDLLLDIIGKTPINSIWNISEDSWEQIPNVFPQLILSKLDYGWEITITNDNRNELMEIIDYHEIFYKIVHQQIIFEEQIIFESYDNMTGSYIKSNFPYFKELMDKYSNKDYDFAVMELLEN